MKNIGRKAAILLVALVAISCGKKGQPTLPVYEKPPVPVELVAVHREAAVYLSWEYPAEKTALVRKFRVMRSTEGSGFRKVGDIEEQMFVDRKIMAGTEYEYHVVARSKDGVSSERSPGTRITPKAVPTAPERLVAEVQMEAVKLSWAHSESGVFFNVYRSFEAGAEPLMPINAESLSEPEFLADPFVKGPVYYSVRALRGGMQRDEGPASGEALVSPEDFVPPPPPTVRATVTAANKVMVAWTTSPAVWVKYYLVYRSVDGSEYELIGRSGTPAFIDGDAPLGTLRYRISSVGPKVEGPKSAFAEVVTK